MEKRYRIREYNGRFTVQIWDSNGERKEKWKWHNTDRFGDRMSYIDNNALWDYSPTFKSKGKAEKRIRKWNSKIIYHNIT